MKSKAPDHASTAGVETFDLFSLKPDVPFNHAFSQLSVLLGCIRHLTTEAEMENDRVAGSAARILSEMAKALIDDLERGMNKVPQYVRASGADLRPSPASRLPQVPH